MTRVADGVADRLARVREEIRAAARRVGRDPSAVHVIAVTKTLPPSCVLAALSAGLGDVGENYVQEARAKRAAVREGRWHLIGGLQRNKVRAAVRVFDAIDTVDSPALVETLAEAVDQAGGGLAVGIQVNVAEDLARRGVVPEDVVELGRAVLAHRSLRLESLMTLVPPGPAENVRAGFRLLREVRNDAQKRLGVEVPHLCMGMSDDFPVAVEEGATLLRLGRALFGARGPSSWRPSSSAGGNAS